MRTSAGQWLSWSGDSCGDGQDQAFNASPSLLADLQEPSDKALSPERHSLILPSSKGAVFDKQQMCNASLLNGLL